MKFAKTIKLFLIDGDSNGRISCELSNWTGKAYKIPRNLIKKCDDRIDLKDKNCKAVYFLVGKDENNQIVVYIGEAEGILKRLNQHIQSKDFWQEAIIIISKDDNLNKAHIKYLENRFYNLAKEANRSKIENAQIPTKSSISESDEAEMEEFLFNVKLLVNTLGYKFFEPIIDEETEQDIIQDKTDIFYLKTTRGGNGKGKPTSEGFVVFEDSEIATSTTPSYFEKMKNLREQLINDKVIANENDKLKFTKDYLFSSASTAAMIITGRSTNGLTAWKLKTGIVLKEYEAPK